MSTGDRNVDKVIEKHRARAQKGVTKYGVTTERKDLSHRDWLQHLQDELMDAAIYIERQLSDLDSADAAAKSAQ